MATASISKSDWSLHRKGLIDQQRHNEKIKEAIKQNLADIVSREDIILSDGKTVIKVPIRSLEEYKFRFDHNKQEGVGQGQGGSKVGDVIGQQGDQPGQGPQAGSEPGYDYYEADVTLDELAALIFEDLGLPNLEQKRHAQLEAESVKFTDIRKHGIMSNLDKRRTIKENIKRNAMRGEPQFKDIRPEDLRFKTWEKEIRYESNAVVLAMMDVSGSMGAIKGCPMHEEPLHLVPEVLRPELEREYGIYIEGDLCPHCRFMVQNEYENRVEDVRIQRVVFSEKHRSGIGTFTPSDPKSQDIAELVGGIDLSTIGEVGVESDPRAYRFDGELNIANRGLMEFIEMLKCDEKFLYVLLTLSQEQNIKTGRFSMIYADEVVMSHTNENEYASFVGNRKSEALQDRIILVKVPYNLRVSDEIRIYEKLLKQSNVLQTVHVAPNTLKIASLFAVLSRLEPPKKAGMSLMKKLKLYDGQDVEGYSRKDVKELMEETVREGMDGISPRYVINRLSSALIREGITCINPIAALRALRDGLDQHTSINKADRERYLNLIDEARREYDDMAKTEVQKAFVYSFEENAKTLLNNYLDNVEAFCNRQKVRDPITDDEVDPDEKLMRSIEEQIGVTENAKKTFREEILIRMAAMARKGQKFEYTSHERLREAIEKKLFADLKDIVKITTSTKTPDAEQLKKVNEVVSRLVDQHGYCHVCANELLKYVGTLLNR